MPLITYPPSLNTDFKKLGAIYRLLKEMYIEHNRVGKIARANWERHQGRWQTYTKQYDVLLSPLLFEYQELKTNIRRIAFPDAEWNDRDHDVLDLEALWGNKAILRESPTEARTSLLDQLKAIDFFALSGMFHDPLENWLDGDIWTETDPNGRLAVAANTLTLVDMVRGDGMSMSGDFGVDHFGIDLGSPHLFQGLVSEVGNESEWICWSLSNTAIPTMTTDPVIQAWFQRVERFFLDIDEGALEDNDFTGAGTITVNVDFWFKVMRDAGGVVLTIYSDAARTIVVDTLTVAQGTGTYRYLNNCYTRAGGNPNQTSGVLKDLDLQEPEPPTPEVVSLPEYGQIRTAIGDPAVFGATILRS